MTNMNIIHESAETNVPHKPEPAASFEIDFLNARGKQIQEAMQMAGDFVFRRSGLNEEGNVFYQGEGVDGTKIQITFTKGQKYKTPAEIALENQEQSE